MTRKILNIKTILTGFILLVSMVYGSTCFAQSKADYTWIWASNPEPLPNKEGTIMTFNSQKRKILYQELPYAISDNNTIISDNEGNLLFYSNGCQVIDSTHNLMPNGDSLNYGYVWENFTLDCSFGYPGFQNSIILSDPGNDNGYYLIHKTIEYFNDGTETDVYVSSLKYTYIDLILNDGLGAVTEKNQVFFQSDSIVSSYLTAVQHENQRDWWLIQMGDFENAYYKFLLSDTGIAIVDTQYLGPVFTENTSAGGQAKFSPDGMMWAMFNYSEGLLLFDFNRFSGQLSNLRSAHVQMDRSFTGMEFSPNSRFIYLSTSDSLWQVDLWEEDWENSIELIDTWDGLNDPFPTTFTLMQMGPDCRIYMCSGNSTKSIHVINRPDEKGQACDFVQHGVSFPFSNNPLSMPNFPRLRVDEEDVCDPTITSVFGVPVEPLKRLKISPNPASERIFVDIPRGLSYPMQLEVLDCNGKRVYFRTVHENDLIFVDVSSYTSGTYLVDIRDNHGKRAVSNVQIVK